MKSLLVLIPLLAIHAFGDSHSEQLKSDNLRKLVCEQLGEELWLEDVPRSLFPGFSKNCEASKADFLVPDDSVIFNRALGKVVRLTVNTKHRFENHFSFSGSISLSRSVDFDQNTGELVIGDWSVGKSKIKFQLMEGAVSRIAEKIVEELYEGRGDAGVSNYDESQFSEVTALAALEAEVIERNQQNSCEREVMSTEREVWEALSFAEEGNSNGAMNLLDLLRKWKMVRFVSGTSVTDWRESCAYHDFYIYLKGGVVISVDYDFTT